MKLFSPDSKFMRAMSMLADLMLLDKVFAPFRAEDKEDKS